MGQWSSSRFSANSFVQFAMPTAMGLWAPRISPVASCVRFCFLCLRHIISGGKRPSSWSPSCFGWKNDMCSDLTFHLLELSGALQSPKCSLQVFSTSTCSRLRRSRPIYTPGAPCLAHVFEPLRTWVDTARDTETSCDELFSWLRRQDSQWCGWLKLSDGCFFIDRSFQRGVYETCSVGGTRYLIQIWSNLQKHDML